ncbi:hypothetical protein Tco_0534531 [Tanacetum coccineum]
MDNVRPRGSYSPIKRSFYTKLAFRPKDLKQDVKTFGVQNMTTAGTRVVVNTGKGKMDTDLRKSRWVWRPKGNYLDHVSKDIGSFMLKKGNLEILLQDHAMVDSGCSSHMTGNKAYLSDYEDYNGGFVAFGSNPKGGKIMGKDLLIKGFDVIRFNFLMNVPVPLDHFPINALTTKVFSFMVKKGKKISRNVTPLFPSMLAQPTEDEGAVSERPSETQPTPSPTHPSEDQSEPQPNPFLIPSSSNPFPDSIPEGSVGSLYLSIISL